MFLTNIVLAVLRQKITALSGEVVNALSVHLFPAKRKIWGAFL